MYRTNQKNTFLLVYEKTSSNTCQYVDNITNILDAHYIDVILADFNINYFNELRIMPLKHIMNFRGYIQVVDKPTFLSAGSLLNQVYVKKNLHNNTENAVISVYYSNHDAVRIVIRN